MPAGLGSCEFERKQSIHHEDVALTSLDNINNEVNLLYRTLIDYDQYRYQ